MRLDLASGQRIADPDDFVVERTLRLIGSGEEYAILIDDENGEQHFIQAAKEPNGIVVEYREGERHHRSNPVPLETAIQCFQAYRRRDRSWKEAVDWKDITGEIGGKSGCRGKAVVLAVLLGVGVAMSYGIVR